MGAGLFLAGLGLSVGGQIYRGMTLRDQAKQQSKLYEEQAREDIYQARQEKEASYREQLQLIRRGKTLKGTQIARAGASGVTTESFLPVLIDTAEQLELDRFNAAEQRKRRVRGFERRSILSQYRAKQARLSGRNALTADIIGAAGTGIQGASIYKELYT